VSDELVAQRPLIKDSLMVLSITLAVLIVAELVLRGGDVLNQTQVTNGEEEPAYQHHPIYHVSLKPGLNRSFIRLDHERTAVTRWSTNSHSFRGSEIRPDKPATRVVVYGDSNVFAQFSNLESTFTYKLQDLLRQMTQNDVEVINGGVPGFGPDQSFLRLEQEADFLKPDIVVLHVFADNDFGDLIRNRLFAADASGRLLRMPPDDWPDPCLDNSKTCLTEPSSSRVNRFFSSLVVVERSRQYLRHIPYLRALADPSPSSIIRSYLGLCEQEFRLYKQADSRRLSHFADHYDYDVGLVPAKESAQVKMKLMEGILGLAKQFAHRKRIKLLVVIQPSSMDLSTNVSPNYRDFAEFPDYRKEGLTQAIERAAKANDIDVLNLFDLFLRNVPERLYLPDGDDHWSEAGQQLAAQAVAAYMATHYPGKAAGRTPSKSKQDQDS
jgi:hypothetical protein